MKSDSCPLERVSEEEYVKSFTSSPICSLVELLNYTPLGDETRRSNTSNKVRSKRKNRKLLVCHDMRGNYLSDRYDTGAIYDGNAFEITNWSEVDLFCYFSHNFITIPPQSWVRACRRHKVRVIGTFITEWDAGMNLCTELFSSSEFVEKAVKSLVNIAIDCDMDGWLINIENVLQTNCIDNVVNFLRILTQSLHDCIGPESQVIWYDAVTTEGQLQWQDGVTELNKPFFDVCDGIFINYTWKENSLLQTKNVMGTFDRSADVFYGVDVFGRGTLGGGGYNCRVALNCLFKEVQPLCKESDISCAHVDNNVDEKTSLSFSAALFAPGWLLETQCTPIDDLQPPLANYHCLKWELLEKSNAFWNAIVLSQESAMSKGSFTCHNINESRFAYSYWGTGFSSASGRALYMTGFASPHWTTVDNSTEKVGESLPPFYDLSLQDMNWMVSTQSDDNCGVTAEGIAGCGVKLCDDLGWEGTGSIMFTQPRHMTTAGQLELPLACHIQEISTAHLDATYDTIFKTMELRKCATDNLEIDISCLLTPLGCIVSADMSDPIEVVFSFRRNSFNKEMEFCFPEECVGKKVFILCNSSYLKSTTVGTTSSRDDDGKDDTHALEERRLWEHCFYSIPHCSDFLPQLIDRFEFPEKCEFLIKFSRACVRISALGAEVYLGAFSFLSGENLSLVEERGHSSHVIAEGFHVNNPFHCKTTGRLGITVTWSDLLWRNSVNNLLQPYDGVRILTVSDTLVRNDLIAHLIDSCKLNINRATNCDTLVTFSLFDNVEEMKGVDDKSLIALGSTWGRSFRLNLCRSHRSFFISRDQDDSSDSTSPFEVYLLILRPFSFACGPTLSSCPVILLFVPCLEH